MFRSSKPQNPGQPPPSSSGAIGRPDALYLLEIYRIITGDEFDTAYHWLRTQLGVKTWHDVKTKYPRGSAELRYMQRVYLFCETLGALMRRGLVNEDLVFAVVGEIPLNAWETMMPWIADCRAELGADFYANVEWLANRLFEWQRSR